MLPYTQNQSLSQVGATLEAPLLVHGVCGASLSRVTELPVNAFGVSSVRLVNHGSVVAVCSECPGIIHGPEAISAVLEDPKRVMKLAVGHNDVLANLIKVHDIFPFKLGTVLSSQTHVRQYLDQNIGRFEMCLRHINQAIEFNIKIFEKKQIRQNLSGQSASAPHVDTQPQGHNRDYSSLHDYLQGRGDAIASSVPSSSGRASSVPPVSMASQQNRNGEPNMGTQTQVSMPDSNAHKAFTTDLMQAMTFFVRETKILPVQPVGQTTKARNLFHAAFLVDRSNVHAFKSCVMSYHEIAESQGMAMSLTGPWPAYNFVSITH